MYVTRAFEKKRKTGFSFSLHNSNVITYCISIDDMLLFRFNCSANDSYVIRNILIQQIHDYFIVRILNNVIFEKKKN